MPGLDRRGPMGAGPMTGGRQGLCARSGGAPAYGGSRFGRRAGFRGGYGCGFGPNRGFGRVYTDYTPAVPAVSQLHPDDELEMLKAEQQAIQRSLDAVEQRISELNAGSSS